MPIEPKSSPIRGLAGFSTDSECDRLLPTAILQLSVLAYNLGNLRRLGLPHRIKSWSLTSLQHKLMKTGGRLVKHARYY